MNTEPTEEQENFLDGLVQTTCVERILKTEGEGDLMGMQAPIYGIHKFPTSKHGEEYAKAITSQLNHLSDSLGVLGFQVIYSEDGLKPSQGYFQIRVLAKTEGTKV